MKYVLRGNEYRSVKEMPESSKPRTRLKFAGKEGVSDLELLCCIIGNGCKDRPVNDIAEDVLDVISSNENVTLDELKRISGLGEAKASVIYATLEIGRRFTGGRKKHFENPSQIFNLIRHYGDRLQEHFIVILLNGALEVMKTEVVTVGLINKTLVHPREVFSQALKDRASAIICCHNHPSGNLSPSTDDIDLTQNLIKAGNILGIKVLDHLIFNDEDYLSMAEQGLMM